MDCFSGKRAGLLFLVIALLLLFSGAYADPPKVDTLEADSIKFSRVRMVGNITDTGGKSCRAWFEYGKTEELGLSTKWQTKNSDSRFYQTLTGLDAETIYYFRAILENSDGEDYGETKTFATGEFPLNTTASNTEKWFNAPFTVSLECEAQAEKCRKTFHRIDYGEWIEGNEISISTQGKQSIEFYSDYAYEKNEPVQETWAGLDSSAPEKVQGLNATDTIKGVLLEWEEALDSVSGIKEYVVYRGEEIAGTVQGTEFSDSEIEIDAIHEYYVIAIDLTGNKSEKSDSVLGTKKSPVPPIEELEIEFIAPQEGVFSPAEYEIKEVIVALYSGGRAVEADSLRAEITIGEEMQEATLVFDQATGNYRALLSEPIQPGKKKISIEIADEGFSGLKEIETEFAPDQSFLFLVFGIIAIVVFAAIALYFIKRSLNRLSGGIKSRPPIPPRIRSMATPAKAERDTGGIAESIGKIRIPGIKAIHSKPPEIKIENEFLAIDARNRVVVELADKEGLARPGGLLVSVKAPASSTKFNIVKNKKMECVGGDQMIKCYCDIPAISPMAKDAKISVLAKEYELGGLAEKTVRVTSSNKEKARVEMEGSSQRMEKLLQGFQKQIGSKPAGKPAGKSAPEKGKKKGKMQEMRM